MTITLEDHVRQLRYFGRVIGDCVTDLKAYRSGVSIAYNIDFGLICAVLFDQPSRGSKEFLTSTKEGMKRVLESANPDKGYFSVVVSGPTMLEFFDQLDHLLRSMRDLHLRIPLLREKYGATDESVLRNSIKTSQEIRRDFADLALLTEQGRELRTREPINKFLKLLDTGAIRGVGDILQNRGIRPAANKSQFERFVAEHLARRRSTDTRSIEDSIFHYKMDAANNCLTLAASKLNDVSMPFVTPTFLNSKQCTFGGKSYSRFDRTPLFLFNLYQLKHSPTPQIGDELSFLNTASKEAVSLADELSEYNRLDECPPFTQLRIARFYKGSGALLDRGSREGGPMDDNQVEEILKMLTDHTRIQETMKDAIQDIKDGARIAELSAANFDFPFIKDLDLDKDPVIERIRKDLEIDLQ